MGIDDEPGVKYHAGSAAFPVLPGGECSDPLKPACASRTDAKTAYLEGPIDCGNNGWYCRIYNDEANGWPSVVLNGDINFGECNKEGSFDDDYEDQDGHCHGSSDDSTYYWWVRDHWHRQYNGKVRCCCGWYQGGTQPMAQGRIANRCDYRRLVTSGENIENCRDANEDHGLSFEGGCDAQYKNQIGAPIPEDDSVCWEIERFGYTDDGFDDGPTPPGLTPTKKPTKAPNGTPPVSEDDDDAPTGSGTDDEAPSGSGDEGDAPSGSGSDDGSPGPNPPAIAPPISPPTSPPTSRSPKAGKGKTKTAKTFKANAGTRTNPFD